MAAKDASKNKKAKFWVNLYEKRLFHKQICQIKHQEVTHEEIWTEEVFIVDATVYGNPTIYKIKDQDSEPIKGTFYEQELQLIVEHKTNHIEKAI